jgi:peptidoglycan hydrolase-like protein with peptidoglycan-binding domain
MKKLILTTAAVLALGMAGAGIGNAADTYSSAPSSSPSTSSSATTQAPTSSTMSQNPAAETSPVKVSEGQIEQAQQRLKTAGLYKGAADGKMGSETKQAISEFQQQNGLKQTGALDQETLAALNNNQNSASTSMSGSSVRTPNSGPDGSLNQSTVPRSNR